MVRSMRLVIGAVGIAVAVSGCGWMHGFSSLSESDKLDQQAQAALSRWAEAVAAAGANQDIVLVGDLTAQVGDWEKSIGDNDKRALMAGLVQAGVSLPTAAEGKGTITWQGGTTQTVPVISAEQAVAEIAAGGAADCTDCTPLRITGARLTSTQVTTTRGSAVAPAWEFTLQGTAVKVTRVAIADRASVALPPWTGPPWGNSGDAAVGIPIDSVNVTGDGRGLTVSFVGAPLGGDQPCGADYTAEGVESSLAVVVIVTARSNGAVGACDAVGARRTASVTLAAPLGNRTVLEVTQGRPVPST